MGFGSSTTATQDTPPPVVTYTGDEDYNEAMAYSDKSSRRKGLLATILSRDSDSNNSSSSTQSSTLG